MAARSPSLNLSLVSDNGLNASIRSGVRTGAKGVLELTYANNNEIHRKYRTCNMTVFDFKRGVDLCYTYTPFRGLTEYLLLRNINSAPDQR